MDVKPMESVLAEVGKAFRLCRFYPSTHPSVQQAMADLSAALPLLAPVGEVELRIVPTGFSAGSTALATRNPQIQEFAGLLYAQGHRTMTIQPGVTADEFATLIRSTAGSTAKTGFALGVVPQAPHLPHIHLEAAVSRRSVARTPRSSPGMQSLGEGPALSARSTGVFRPNALPPDIEAHRLVALLEVATAEGARGPLSRLGEVVAELAGQRDFRTLSEAVRVLARWQRSDDPPAAEAAQRALAACVDDATLSGMVGIVADGKAAGEQREAALQALGAVGERAVPALFEAYLAASEDPVREAYAQAFGLTGAVALGYLVARVASDQTDTVRAAAALPGATAAAQAVPTLTPLVRHADAGVRRAAIGALARLGGPEGSRLVVAALRDADPGVRYEAAAGVGRLGDRALAGILLGKLKDETDDGVVTALIETLGRLKEARAVPQLTELARGVSGVFQRFPVAVRIAAVRALVRIGTPDALAAAAPFKDDRNPDVRNAALEVPQ
jgi:HEAT repeat protein